ncbi:MAG: SDR family NAD(P)-dependent oxidoreductase, partial [Planctomycetes bacterium]|nr:SDR family NAD(P)-dependent oxidoreductase [Planctomycetota bacterium]
MSVLSDKVVIITGASSGIGEAAALALARRNARVVLAARRQERLEALAKRLVREGGRAIWVACDVRRRADVQSVVDTAVRDFGSVDV